MYQFLLFYFFFFFFQAEDGIRDYRVTGVQTCASSDLSRRRHTRLSSHTIISYAVFCLRSEEHTSELQSHDNIVCRLLLEKKKKNRYKHLHVIYGPVHTRRATLCARR